MKKKICVLLALFMMLVLAACGKKESVDYLVLVNKENKLPDTWEENIKTVTIKNSLGDNVEVEEKAYEAYVKLRNMLSSEGVRVDLDSARRSVEEQQRIWDDFIGKYGEEYTRTYVAEPGYSEHHTGLALDLYINVGGKDIYENEDMMEYPEIWAKIKERLPKYGFILRYLEGKEDITGYGYEPWHIRYVGSPEIAKEIMSKGITLEEYLERLPETDVAPKTDEDVKLSLWTKDSAAKNKLVDFVSAAVTEGDSGYIPKENRIAVFDLDGTLFCETDPNYFDYTLLVYRVLEDPDYKDIASDFEREVALKIVEQNRTGASFEGLETEHGKAIASAFKGMTLKEFNDYIQEFKKLPMPNYPGMKRGDGWYKPMLQVVEYLKENDFTVYVVSGTDRFIVRGIVYDSPLDLPMGQIIGSDETLVAPDQGDTDGLKYVYDDDDKLVLGGDFIIKNLKMNKVTVIAQEIGVQPVLSFGNSTGDSGMAEYVTTDNPYPSLAFMLCCDDTLRENGNTIKASKMYALCTEYDWVPVSMKNDWTTIYGDEVKRNTVIVTPTAAPVLPSREPVQEAEEPEPEEPEIEKNGDIVILYSADVHCAIDEGFGYEGFAEIRDTLIAQGNEVILVDDGDSIRGEAIGTMTKGGAIVELMNKMGYSVAIPGNHEFDYGMDRFLELRDIAEFPYISCNFTYNGEPVLQPYVMYELAGKKIAFVGVTTPRTITSSTPTFFQNEAGEYDYGFCQDMTGEALYNAVQTAVDSARAEGAEYVVVLGHLGNEEVCRPWTYMDVIANTKGFDVLLDGHSHDTDQVVMQNAEGKDVLRSACGTRFEYVGYVKIKADGTVSTGLYHWTDSVSPSELFGIENEMTEAIKEVTEELNTKLKEVVAGSDVTLTISDPTEKDDNGKAVRIIRKRETNLGDLCADAYRIQTGADIGIVNGGGIRVNIASGDITLENIYSVFPFNNSVCVIAVTGQQILDALEWGARLAPGENGGFLQVSGLSYEIDTSVPSSCTFDENGLFTGITGTRRVKNVFVGEEPIDPRKAYTLASHDYMLLEHGDGFTMFDGAPLLQDFVKLDNQLLIDFIVDNLGGVIGEEYADPYGQGRITVK